MISIKSVIDQFTPGADTQEEDKPKNLGELDFETPVQKQSYGPLGQLDFEAPIPEIPPEYYTEEGPSVYEDLIKPTAKAAVKIPASILASMALLPGAGIRAGIELIPTISSDPSKLVDYGSLDKAMEVYNQIMSVPGELITTSEEAKAVEYISKVFKPIEMAGEGWRLIGQGIESGLTELGLPVNYIEPLLATMGESAAVFAMPELVKGLNNSAWYRTLTIKEKGLVVQSLADAIKRNPTMTEGQLLRTYDNPAWRAEALAKRSITDDYANMKSFAETKTKQANAEKIIKVKKNNPPKPKQESTIQPTEIAEYEFTSRKGNYYTKSGGKWFNKEGKEIRNNYVIKAAERGKVEVAKPTIPPVEVESVPMEQTKPLNEANTLDEIEDRIKAEVQNGNVESVKELVEDVKDTLTNISEGTEAPDGMLRGRTQGELEQFKSEFDQLSSWIDKLSEDSGLYSGIPVTQIPKAIKGLYDKITGKGKHRTSDPNVIITPPPEAFRPIVPEGRELVKVRRAGLDVANYETNKFINSIERKTNSKQREVLPFVIEKTGIPKELGRPDLEKVLASDKTKLEPVAKEIKEHFDRGFKAIKKHIPELSVKQIEDYVTHLWDIPKRQRAEAANWFSTQNRFIEKRFIDTYEEGIKRGYKPKTLDINEIIRIHDSVSNRAIENAKFIDAIMKLERDGVRLVTRDVDAPLDYVEMNYPALDRRIPRKKSDVKKGKGYEKTVNVKVHPDLVKPLRVVFEERFDHPVLGAYESLNGIMKKSILSASLFHHMALGESAIASGVGARSANLYFNPVKIYKGLVKGELDIFKNEAIAKDSITHGVQYGASSDIPVGKIQQMLGNLSKSSERIPGVNKVTKAIEGMNSIWDKALWDYLHDSMKLYAYESMVGKLDPRLNPEQVRMSKREIGQLINDTFGGQNWDNLMMTPKGAQMLGWGLLSPDWTISTARQALAPTGIGKVYNETARLRKKLGSKYWLRAAIYFGIGMNLVNYAMREKDMKDNPQYYENKQYAAMDKTMFGNTIGKKTKLFVGRYDDGSERYLNWGKQFRDFAELMIHPVKKLGGKAAPVPQLVSKIFTGSSMSGYKNDDTYGKEGLDAGLGIVKTIGKNFIPISVNRMIDENLDFYPLDIVMQSTKGMSRYKVVEYFKKAILDNDQDMFVDVYEGALRNNLPAFTLFNYSLSAIDFDIRSQLAEAVKSIEDIEAKMSLTKDPKEKKMLGNMLSQKRKEEAEIRTGLKLLRSAQSKAEVLGGMSRKVPRLP